MSQAATSDDASLIRSELLLRDRFAHGFSTRRGGVSRGEFASFNLARTVDDDPEAVAENATRFCAAVGTAPAALHEVSQVHGRAVHLVARGASVASSRSIEADALVNRTPGACVAVRTADCVPLLMAHPASGDVAAVHAGWRGVEARIVAAAVEVLGHPPDELIVAIGPHIRAFEVSEEIAERLAAVAHGARVVEARAPRPYVDLALTLRAQLTNLGVERIDDVGGCTLSEPERFFSHRRDRGRTGRHLSAIIARSP